MVCLFSCARAALKVIKMTNSLFTRHAKKATKRAIVGIWARATKASSKRLLQRSFLVAEPLELRQSIQRRFSLSLVFRVFEESFVS